jgi:hypothetical protein
MTCTSGRIRGATSWRADAGDDRALAAERIAAGAGRVAVLHALDLLGSILLRALESERIGRNPVRIVRKVRRAPRREVRPLAPVTVEALRGASGHRDAVLISVLA